MWYSKRVASVVAARTVRPSSAIQTFELRRSAPSERILALLVPPREGVLPMDCRKISGDAIRSPIKRSIQTNETAYFAGPRQLRKRSPCAEGLWNERAIPLPWPAGLLRQDLVHH